MSVLLEVRDLRTSFAVEAGELSAVDGVSFALDAGRTLAIVGESGCGKSVTALSIMGLIATPPGRVSGEIRFEGVDLMQVSPAQMRETLFVAVCLADDRDQAHRGFEETFPTVP